MRSKESGKVETTIASWAKRKGKQFSHEEAREACGNIIGFFRVLAEWNSQKLGPRNLGEVQNIRLVKRR